MQGAEPQNPPEPSRAGERRRRRGLYGPPPRLTRTSPLTGRLLWAIGDWGRASEHIGSQWEHLAADLLRQRLQPGSYLVAIHADPTLLAEVVGTNLAHADAALACARDGALVLEPLDFKWSLETANVRQVSPETLGRLLEQELPRLSEAFAAARRALGLPDDAPVQPADGQFVAPEHPANRSALRDDPDLPHLLLPVDAYTFFSPLPAWETAVAAARVEGADLGRVRSLEAVERYYRIGAGIMGALTRLNSGLFEEEPAQVDTATMVLEMRSRGRAPNLNVLLVDLDRQSQQRRALEERLAAIPRVAYPFGRFRADLVKAKAPRSLLESRGALARAYGEVTRPVAAQVRAEGRALVASRVHQVEALAHLEATPEQWATLALPHVRRVAAAAAA